VAVSGGKDSLALWDILVRLGYKADGLYLGLGIGEYSDESGDYTRAFAARLGRPLHEGRPRCRRGLHDPGGGCGHPTLTVWLVRALQTPPLQFGGHRARLRRRRHRHNLDDEAAVLLGNVLRWDTGYLGRQHPVLPATPGFVRKVKPLVRLGEREMAAYCVLQGIDYQVEECPMAAGNRHLGYKEVLNALEERSPGSKAAFLFRLPRTRSRAVRRRRRAR